MGIEKLISIAVTLTVLAALGATGEIVEFEAARILKLTLASAREPGYGAKKMDVDFRTEAAPAFWHVDCTSPEPSLG